MGEEVVLRVGQLDAAELDAQLTDVLQAQLLGALKFFSLSKFSPELKLFLRWYLWKCSLYTNGRTFGQKMLDLKYSSSCERFIALGKCHRIALFCLNIVAPWLLDRVDLVGSLVQCSLFQTLRSQIMFVLRILSLLNFTTFLVKGRFPTLQDRLVGVGIVPDRRQNLRQMHYDYIDREVVWNGFAEFVFNVLPHFNSFAIRNLLRSTWRRFVPPRGIPTLSPSVLRVKEFLACRFCESAPTLPYVTNCNHVYCYYCIAANCMADSSFPCCACGTAVHSFVPARLPDFS